MLDTTIMGKGGVQNTEGFLAIAWMGKRYDRLFRL